MNRLTTCKKMVEDLFTLNGNADITIIDNASTYEPLLDWYKQAENDIKIIRHDKNHGPWVFFYGGIFSTIDSEYYVYSDADLELNSNMPSNWQEIMVDYINKYDRKASLVLRIDDIPDYYEFKTTILNHQNICWDKTDEPNVYLAVTDMTFTLDQKNKGYRYESIRIGGDFAARHIPWYIDFNNISQEELYYLKHINSNFNDALYSNTHLQKIKDLKT
jgi:hypothetical protein